MYSYGGSTQCNAMQWAMCLGTPLPFQIHTCAFGRQVALWSQFFPKAHRDRVRQVQHTHTYRPHSLLAACSEQKAHVPLLPNIATSQTLARVYTALLSTSSVALALRLHSRILARLCSEEEAHRHIVCVPFVPNKRASRTTPCQPHIKHIHTHTQRISSSWTRSPYHLLLLVYHLMITTRTTRTTRIGHG